jgi:hypothetical protein
MPFDITLCTVLQKNSSFHCSLQDIHSIHLEGQRKHTKNIGYDNQFSDTDNYFLQLTLTKLIPQYVEIVDHTVSYTTYKMIDPTNSAASQVMLVGLGRSCA